MCNALGVDPLAASVGNVVKGKEKGNERGWWALLKNRSAGGGSGSGSSGGSGSGGSSGGGSSGGEGQHEDDLHLRLAMRVVEICRAGRSINGGLLGVEDCREMVKKGQGIGGEVEVTEYVFFLLFLNSPKGVEISPEGWPGGGREGGGRNGPRFSLTSGDPATIYCVRSSL